MMDLRVYLLAKGVRFDLRALRDDCPSALLFPSFHKVVDRSLTAATACHSVTSGDEAQ